MKKIATLIILITTINTYAQTKLDYSFGKITNEEVSLKRYEPDTTANALVLYESGDTSFKVGDKYILISTKYYVKIKLFNKEGFKHATIEIPLYFNDSRSEHVKDIKAVTHNNYERNVSLDKSHIYEEKVHENWKEVKFTMPNLKEGSIIEVEYVVESPFKFNLTGWKFQSDIPKKFSQYKALIPGNYLYNRNLTGYLRLKTNSSVLKKKCFSVPGYVGHADCELITYAMQDIPAFIKEDYMTDEDNFLSRIKFELTKTEWFDGSKKKFTTTWQAVDKEFKTDKNIGVQLKKLKFFEDKLPPEIDSLPNDLTKAKAVYNFIQNHFTWNKKYSIFKNVKVKKAFENNIGNVGEINISLMNALKVIGLKTELVLLSTRKNGFPTKLYPVISDFNYVIAKVNINDKFYLLDATDKLAPFGLLPFRCLNSYGRVMDFENDSYWLDIVPIGNSKTQLNASLIMNEDGSMNGKLRKIYFGYDALNRRAKLLNKNDDAIILDIESELNNVEITDYQIENRNNIDKPIIETMDIEIEGDKNVTMNYLNPFFGESFKNNPFKQENRLYPVDFGYPRKYLVNFVLELPDNYNISSYPKSKAYTLQEAGGQFSLNSRKHQAYKFTLNSTLKINKPIFYSFEYEGLKNLFKQAINLQKTPIAIKKVVINE